MEKSKEWFEGYKAALMHSQDPEFRKYLETLPAEEVFDIGKMASEKADELFLAEMENKNYAR